MIERANVRDSITTPLLLAVIAPLSVYVCIEILRSVWWTFAIYQVGICLVAPAAESRLRGRTWREHAELLGLVRVGDRDDFLSRRSFALALGLATLLVTGVSLLVLHHRFLDPARLEATVAGWGVAPGQMVAMMAVMAVLNAAAEELFWRGYLPGRVGRTSPPPVGLSVVLPAILYTSYHVATISRLVEQTAAVVLMIGGVLGAGLFWGWLRRRTGSVWPALLSHGGAVVAYLAVHAWLTSGNDQFAHWM